MATATWEAPSTLPHRKGPPPLLLTWQGTAAFSPLWLALNALSRWQVFQGIWPFPVGWVSDISQQCLALDAHWSHVRTARFCSCGLLRSSDDLLKARGKGNPLQEWCAFWVF